MTGGELCGMYVPSLGCTGVGYIGFLVSGVYTGYRGVIDFRPLSFPHLSLISFSLLVASEAYDLVTVCSVYTI